MSTATQQVNNRLWIARRKAGLGQKSVARLLGHKSTSPISEYEAGKKVPGLRTALKLSVIYQTRLEDLYTPIYNEVTEEVEALRQKTPMIATPAAEPSTKPPLKPPVAASRPQTSSQKRILAVDPSMEYLGLAVLEGQELIWHGIKTFPGKKTLPHMRSQVKL